jgi:peptidoglycan/xylan/chitin deacetylase (PgdA/CDA1 family)
MPDGVRWPEDCRVAVAFNFAWESWPQDLGTAASQQFSNRPPVPTGSRFERDMWTVYEHAYAETGGLQRLVDLWDRYSIRPTVFANGKTLTLYPDMARDLDKRGYDFAAEGWEHSYAPTMSEGEERESIERSVKAFESVLGHRPQGYVSAGGKSTPITYSVLADNDFKWVGGVRNTDCPYVLPVGTRKLVCMNNYMLSDYSSYSHHGWTPRQLAEMMKDEFDALYEEGARAPKMLSFGMHAFLARGFRIRPFEAFIQYVLGFPKVWVASRSEIADWVLTEFPELTLETMFPSMSRVSAEQYDLPR